MLPWKTPQGKILPRQILRGKLPGGKLLQGEFPKRKLPLGKCHRINFCYFQLTSKETIKLIKSIKKSTIEIKSGLKYEPRYGSKYEPPYT